MSIRTVYLKTAHFIDNVWHGAGKEVGILEKHFDASSMEPVGWTPESPAAPVPAPESVSIEDFAALVRRVEALEAHPAVSIPALETPKEST